MRGRHPDALNVANLDPLIKMAFNIPNVKAVALAISSPGGSAAESSLLYKRIRSLSESKHVPVYTFIEEAGASGGYYLSLAADEIYADPNSIVGSIGVVPSSFGLHNFISKHGIERRVIKAGQNKTLLDPFLPAEEKDINRLKRLQGVIHENFKAIVKERRGTKLAGRTPEELDQIYSGEVYTGAEAVRLGLVDGIGDVFSVIKQKFGPDVRLLRLRRSAFANLFGWDMRSDAVEAGSFTERLTSRISAQVADSLISTAEQQAAWKRYGL